MSGLTLGIASDHAGFATQKALVDFLSRRVSRCKILDL